MLITNASRLGDFFCYFFLCAEGCAESYSVVSIIGSYVEVKRDYNFLSFVIIINVSFRMSHERTKIYIFKKFFSDIVLIFTVFAFNCKPLSEVNNIGLSSLYFSATANIILSGER